MSLSPRAAKQRGSDLCCHAVVKPGAHSFKIKGALHFHVTFTAVLESKVASS